MSNTLKELKGFKNHLSQTVNEMFISVNEEGYVNIPDLKLELNGKKLVLPLHADLSEKIDNFLKEVIEEEEK